MRRLLPILAVLALVPATASAVTAKEIVSLSKAGVSEQVILALIDRDKTFFTLQADEIVTLQKEGLTDAILVAMLRSGRAEPVPPPAPVAELPPEPMQPIVVIGHGPDRPNAQSTNNGSDVNNAAAVPYGPYYMPVPYVVPGIPGRAPCGVRSTVARGDAATGIFFTNPVPSLFFQNQEPAVRAADCPPPEPRRSPPRR